MYSDGVLDGANLAGKRRSTVAMSEVFKRFQVPPIIDYRAIIQGSASAQKPDTILEHIYGPLFWCHRILGPPDA